MHSICHDDILAHLKSNVDFHYLLRGFKGSFVRGAQYMYLLTFGAGQKINPFHGTVALVRMAPLLIVLYKLSLLKIVEKTVDFGVISIPFCAINAHCAINSLTSYLL